MSDMQRFQKIVSGLAVGAMLLGASFGASAQSTPTPNVDDPRYQLAAVTPGSEDLPTGYEFVGETFLDIEQVSAGGFDREALASTGFVSQYVSVYENADTDQRIRAYASLWTDDAAAEAGFGILEDETITNPNDPLEDSVTDVGEEPREATIGTYTAADGTVIGTADVTFRRGPMVVGVAHETFDASEADEAVATELAVRMDERAEAVLAGESLPHVDMALPGMVVSFEGEGNGLAQAGFLGPVEVESVYGVQGSLLSGIDTSWVETTLVGATASSPSITIALSTFANEQDAQFVVEQAGDIFPPFADQEAVEDVMIDGADAASAFRYASSDDGDVDSYRLLYATGGMLTVIDVQRATSGDGAEEAAMTIAVAQMECQEGTACEAPDLPEGFSGQ
jgi:hypothetical protein